MYLSRQMLSHAIMLHCKKIICNCFLCAAQRCFFSLPDHAITVSCHDVLNSLLGEVEMKEPRM